MSEAKRYVPYSPDGRSRNDLSADIRHQAIGNIKEQFGGETWANLVEQGWRIIDTEGCPQFEMYK